jgi:hypothetical protein
MNILEKNSGDRRKWERFKCVLQGKYYLEQRGTPRGCTVLDISVTGACLKVPGDEEVAAGTSIFIEVLNGEMNKITIEALAIWCQHTDESVLVGCWFVTMLDTATFESLK